MGAKRYGHANGQKKPTLNDYHQSKDELAGLPQTVAEKIPVTSTPNIFSYKSYIFAKNPALVQRYIKATKADVGGVGGHVVAADEVKSIVAKFVLYNNGYRGEPIFTSLIVTHTGDDVALTGIFSATVCGRPASSSFDCWYSLRVGFFCPLAEPYRLAPMLTLLCRDGCERRATIVRIAGYTEPRQARTLTR